MSDMSPTNSKKLLQELNDVRQFLKIERDKYRKYKIVHDAVQECVSSSDSLDTEFKTNIQGILLSQSCAQALFLKDDNNQEPSSLLLGVSSQFTSFKLNTREGATLQKVVETSIQKKYDSICQEFRKMTGQDIREIPTPGQDSLGLDLSNEEHGFFAMKRKLNEQQIQYLSNLRKEQEILNDFIKLRLEDLPIMCNKKVEEYQVKSRMNCLKNSIVQERMRVDIFSETTHSYHAYKELLKDVKEQQATCKNDINHLKELKDKYQQVDCKQFSDLLKVYAQYKMSLEKKKLMLKSLKN